MPIPHPLPDSLTDFITDRLPKTFQAARALPGEVLSQARSQFGAAAARAMLPLQRRRDIALFERTGSLGNFDEMKRIAATYADAVTW